jgi:hypothetical protein
MRIALQVNLALWIMVGCAIVDIAQVAVLGQQPCRCFDR